jgi:hypothetical protein
VSLVPEVVTIQRPTRTGTGAGGKVETYVTTQAGVIATRNYYSSASQRRMEDTGGADGPGASSSTRCFFTFRAKPFPSIQREYLIVEPDGTQWRVLQPPRVYQFSMQADCEALR